MTTYITIMTYAVFDTQPFTPYAVFTPRSILM